MSNNFVILSSSLCLVILISLTSLVVSSKSQEVDVTFYENANRQGQSITVKAKGEQKWQRLARYRMGSCRNLPQEWWDRASSIDTHGNDCIVVYSREGCQTAANPIRFYGNGETKPDAIPQNDFRGTWFDDQARSFMICHRTQFTQNEL